jgi:hypothetical protein
MADGFSGMADLIRSLEQLPEQMKAEAGHIVQDAANGTATEIRQAYPQKDGDLVRGVEVEQQGELRWKVRSRAPHAHLYEYGTVQRSLNSNGANRGTMPAQPTVIPIAQRRRRRMLDGLKSMLQRAKVRGMTGSLDVRETR